MSRINAAALIEDLPLRSSVTSLLTETPDAELLGIGSTTAEISTHLDDPELDVVLVHTELAKVEFRTLIREIQSRRPFVAILVIAAEADTALLQSVMELGARGVLAQPLSLHEFQGRLEAAASWSRGMRQYSGGEAREERGRIVALAGAKGGLGTSTLAVLLVAECARAGKTSCIVDANLRDGMIRYFTDVKPRRSFADLADVASELTGRTVREVVVDAEAGFSVLVAPSDVERADDISGTSARQVLHQLRYLYDVIVVDVGNHLEDPQAAVLEMADDVLLVVGPDIASLHAARHTVTAWERLAVRQSRDLEFVFNGSDRKREVQPDMAGRILGREPVAIVPSSPAQLEASHNVGNLTEVKEGSVRASVRRLAEGMSLISPPRSTTRGKRSRRRQESGQASVELPFAVALFLVAFLVAVQAMFAATALAFARHGATTAAREMSVTGNVNQARHAAADVLPGVFEDNMTFTGSHGQVRVQVRVPTVLPIGSMDLTVSQTATVRPEPGR